MFKHLGQFIAGGNITGVITKEDSEFGFRRINDHGIRETEIRHVFILYGKIPGVNCINPF